MYIPLYILSLFFVAKSLKIITGTNTITNSNNYILKYEQIRYKNSLENDNIPIIICTGASGTGKTMIACYDAINKLQNNMINRIIITRPSVTVEEELGFLPGTLEDKLYPFMIPIYDYFYEFYTKDQLNKMIKQGTLEIAPLAFMRGRTFSNCFIIADEMQNSTPSQLKMLLTRIGLNSKLVITGDLEQNDLDSTSGLVDFIELLNKKYIDKTSMLSDGFDLIKLSNNCIERHQIIKKILSIYNKNLY
jgi:phosphate starvation-inducible PhoH-like protein